jgi:hypothetical protein
MGLGADQPRKRPSFHDVVTIAAECVTESYPNHRRGALASPLIETQRLTPRAIDIGIAPSSARECDELAIRAAVQQNRRITTAGLT